MTDPYANPTSVNPDIAQGDFVTITGFPEVPMLVCSRGTHFADLIWFANDRTMQKVNLRLTLLVKVKSEQKVDTAKFHDNVTPRSICPAPRELTQEQFNRAVDKISRQDD